jgi:hypothetical protein
LPDLTGLAALLSDVEPPAELEPPAENDEPDGVLVDMVRRRRAARRRHRRRTAVLGAAAAIALVVAGATVGAAADHEATVDHVHQQIAHDHQNLAADLLRSGEARSATDPRTGVVGTIAMESRGWGTNVALDLGNVHGPLTCRLVAVARTGGRHVVTEWAVPPKGYGVPGSPAHLKVHGGTAITRADLVRFEVEANDGRTLLRLPV